MPNLYYVDIYGFSGDCACARVVLKLIKKSQFVLYISFPQNPNGCDNIILAKAKNFGFVTRPCDSPFLSTAQFVPNAAASLPAILRMFHSPLFECFHTRVKFLAAMLLYQSDSSLFPSHSSPSFPSPSSPSLNDLPLFVQVPP